MKEIATWAFLILAFSLIVVIEVAWICTGSCQGVMSGPVGEAWHMMTYAALWGGLGTAPLVKGVSRWMRGTLRDLSVVSATYSAEVKRQIESTIRRFSAAAMGVSSYMLPYLVLLTLFPERCVVLEERIVIILLPAIPLGLLLNGYWQIRSRVNRITGAAELYMKAAIASALIPNSSQVETDSQTKRPE